MPSLTQDEAVIRAALLRVHAYDIDLDLTATRDGSGFTSTTILRFTRRAGRHDLRRAGAGRARSGRAQRRAAWTRPPSPRNRLPLAGLAGGQRAGRRGRMAYSNTGEGLHRFVDPADGERLPVRAHVPGRRPPDLRRASTSPTSRRPFTLAVTAPPDWLVRRQRRAGRCCRRADGGEFAPTQAAVDVLRHADRRAVPRACRRARRHPAGPLLPPVARRAPRRARPPRSSRSPSSAWTATTRCSSVRYPFGNYEQAFVPEFNFGAMENPGLVIFRDEFIYRSAVTDSRARARGPCVDRARDGAHVVRRPGHHGAGGTTCG